MKRNTYILTVNFGCSNTIAIPASLEICTITNSLQVRLLCFYFEISGKKDIWETEEENED